MVEEGLQDTVLPATVTFALWDVEQPGLQLLTV
jgi:hypothetical protein